MDAFDNVKRLSDLDFLFPYAEVKNFDDGIEVAAKWFAGIYKNLGITGYDVKDVYRTRSKHFVRDYPFYHFHFYIYEVATPGLEDRYYFGFSN